MIIQENHMEKGFGTCRAVTRVDSQPEGHNLFPLELHWGHRESPVAPSPTTPYCLLQCVPHCLTVLALALKPCDFTTPAIQFVTTVPALLPTASTDSQPTGERRYHSLKAWNLSARPESSGSTQVQARALSVSPGSFP